MEVGRNIILFIYFRCSIIIPLSFASVQSWNTSNEVLQAKTFYLFSLGVLYIPCALNQCKAEILLHMKCFKQKLLLHWNKLLFDSLPTLLWPMQHSSCKVGYLSILSLNHASHSPCATCMPSKFFLSPLTALATQTRCTLQLGHLCKVETLQMCL